MTIQRTLFDAGVRGVPYDRLPYIPTMLAEQACAGSGMDFDDIREFADLCEVACRSSYESGGWFFREVKARDARARLLGVFVHWREAWVLNRGQFRRRFGVLPVSSE